MIGILILSHGDLAKGMKNSVELIGGVQEKFEIETLPYGMGVDEFSKKIEEKITILDDGDGVLVFVDLFGGTPFKVMCRLQNRYNVYCINGVNLPMVLEAALTRHDRELIEFAKEITETGKEGIGALPKLGL